MTRSAGSAAAEAPRASTPRSAVATTVSSCAARLAHAARIAASAAKGREPELGAEFILDTLEDLSAELAQLRSVVRRSRRKA